MKIKRTASLLLTALTVVCGLALATLTASAADYLPGDLNGDGLVSSTDVVFLRRHIAGGYNITVNEAAGDVNADGILNTTDVVTIRRYIAGGYGVELKPAPDVQEATPDEYFVFSLMDDGTYSVRAKDVNNMPAEVIIPATHQGKAVTCIDQYAFSNCKNLTSIIIPDSITNIGEHAFFLCRNLSNITLSNNLTLIDNWTFSGCSSLVDISIPHNVTSICEFAFYDCTSLSNIIIPLNVSNIGVNIFGNCLSLKDIQVDPHNISYCSIDGNLYSKDLTKLICHPAGNKESTFNIPDSVTHIEDYAFAYCATLTNIQIPDCVTVIDSFAFFNCTSLANILIPDCVTSIGWRAFFGCENLVSITLPKNVMNIEEEAFGNCNKLKIVYYNGTQEDWKTLVIGKYNDSLTAATYYYTASQPNVEGNWWHYVDGIPTIWEISSEIATPNEYFAFTLLEDNTYAISAMDPCNMPDKIVLPSHHQGKSVSTIGVYMANGAFRDITNIVSLSIPDSITTINGEAFYGCIGLENITLPASVSYIGQYVFSKCTNLESILVDVNNTTYCSIDGNLYTKNGSGLIRYAPGKKETSFEISSTVNSIGDYAFEDCSYLVNIGIPNNVTNIGYRAFENCTKLQQIQVYDNNPCYRSVDGNLYLANTAVMELLCYPAGNTNRACEIPEGVTGISDSAFSNAINLEYITIPNSVTWISSVAFGGCSKLTKIVIPDSIIHIGEASFLNCVNLITLSIPKNINEIGDNMFNGCTKLTALTIPHTVTNIGWQALVNCTALTDITFTGTKEQWNAITKAADWNNNTGAYTVHCTDGDIPKS